jgi:hypothetical protein
MRKLSITTIDIPDNVSNLNYAIDMAIDMDIKNKLRGLEEKAISGDAIDIINYNNAIITSKREHLKIKNDFLEIVKVLNSSSAVTAE